MKKQLQELLARVNYARDILGNETRSELDAFAGEIAGFAERTRDFSEDQALRAAESLETRLSAIESAIDAPAHGHGQGPHRAPFHNAPCLKDILENVYDNYTEIGGQDEHSIDPGMLIARAYITRRRGKKVINQPVMVVGQEKGHGEEFRNGGSIKPWGNSKALKYMKVAALEQIPIHAYVNTPGSYPVEDFPGAAQQIAENIYEMAGLSVPIVAIFSEGGSGGAEAIGMADKRLMLSHGYYSVISPEGAAAIEGRIRGSQRAPAELIESCAVSQRITAQDNLQNGYIDEIIQEPPPGRAGRSFRLLQARPRAGHPGHGRGGARRARRAPVPRPGHAPLQEARGHHRPLVPERGRRGSGSLPGDSRNTGKMAQHAYQDNRSLLEKLYATSTGIVSNTTGIILYGLIKPFRQRIERLMEEVTDEVHVITGRVDNFVRGLLKKARLMPNGDKQKEMELTGLSEAAPAKPTIDPGHRVRQPPGARRPRGHLSPRRQARLPGHLGARPVHGTSRASCPHCGYNFPMEYQWYLHNVFDEGSVREFNRDIASGNPAGFPNFEQRVEAAKEKTGGLQSSCMTFNATLEGLRVTCATLIANFRGGSVGAAEGEKFIRALELAGAKHQPFLAYIHGTAGIRIQEGVNGLIQMPRVTMAVRKYIEDGGLYIVLYDTNSYAGPVASFLGCSPYQYAVRSSRLGFAGPGVIKETTGMEIPPNYHNSFKALSRGHIQGVWSRTDIRKNLHQAFLTIGGRNLYYR